MNVTVTRFVVDAMHKQLPGGGLAVDYWRVLDTATGMRADGTAKYSDPADAQRWADGLNDATDPGTPGAGALPH